MVRKLTRKRKLINSWAYGAFYTLLLNASAIPSVFAGPSGGQVVGGSGTINQSGNATTINQNTQNMAINWQSYNVGADERVQYIQPNSTSVSLNRILSQNGSTIAGRIDANGQVILVNPNGVFFTPTSVINVGGIIASGLDFQPTDFMNGDYIFNEVLGTEGAVINSGMINASLGGNVALIGKQVENNGVIVANLGTVNLAAGKQAVLTFDNSGMLGVRISEEILQDELGVDPAVVNSGEIQAEGGRVLLTASTSQDVFSQAVNTSGLDQATSVVVHEDGSFTLGGGADVINTGSIDTSTTTNDQNAGRIVLIGENVTSSGELNADAASGNGGEIEIHSQDTTLLTENSITSVRSESNGKGGIVKVLGDKVGLFDQSTVDVSGANGGGQVLVGGDYQGNNSEIRNSNITYVSSGTNLYADALQTGDAGKIINWADDTTLFYGNAFARGGAATGNGGLVEVSGKKYLDYNGYVNTSAVNGELGVLLLDPTDITILDGTGDTAPDGDTNNDEFHGCPTTPCNAGNRVYGTILSSYVGPTQIYESELEGIASNTNIVLQATNDITINDLSDNELQLNVQSDAVVNNRGSITFVADADNANGGSFSMNTGDTISTRGGAITISGDAVTTGNLRTSTNGRVGGDVTITAAGNVNVASIDTRGGSVTGTALGLDGGAVDLQGVNITVGLVNTSGSDSDGDVNGIDDGRAGDAGTITLNASNNVLLNGALTANGGNGPSCSNCGDDGHGGNGALIDITVGQDITVTSTATIVSNGGNGPTTADDGNGGIGGGVTFNAGRDVTVNAAITSNGGNGPANPQRTNDNGFGADAGAINITAARDLNINTSATISSNGGNGGDGNDNGGHANSVTLSVGNNLNISANITALGGNGNGSGSDGTNGTIIFNGDNSNNIFNINNGASFNGATATINGLGGEDILTTASTENNIWTIDGNDTGLLENNNNALDLEIRFNQIERLTGNNGDDSFIFTASGNFSGLLDGAGAATVDTLFFQGTINRTVQLGDRTIAQAVSDTNLNVNNIEILTGQNTANNTLIADNATNTWNISNLVGDGVNDGTVAGVAFINFNNLTGNAAIDNFSINTTGSVTGSINGAGDTDQFTISGSVGVLNAGAGLDTINVINGGNVTTLNGGGDVDTITVGDGASTGSVGTINGDAGNDVILVNTDGNVTVSLNGNGGGDAITVNGTVTAINAGSGNDIINLAGSVTGVINGGAGADSLTVTAGIAGDSVIYELGNVASANINVFQVETLTANAVTTNTLQGDSTTNNMWNVAVAGNSVNDGATTTTFSNITILEGGNGAAVADTFNVSNTGITSIDARGGDDNITLTSAGLVGTVGGGAGTDNLTVSTGDNTWAIDNFANNDGRVWLTSNNTLITNFTSMETRTGSGGGNDVIDLSNPALGAIDVALADYVGFGLIIGNDQSNLIGIDGQQNDWSIQQVNDGTSLTDGINDGTVNASTRFINFLNLTGGDGVDNFTVADNGALTGRINGGAGTNTLFGANVINTWTVNGATDSTLSYTTSAGAAITSFTGIDNLTGGAARDDFTLQTGTVAGVINGNGLNDGDTLTILVGGNQTIELANRTNANINVYQVENITANINTNNTLLSDNLNTNTHTWRVNSAGGGFVNDGSAVTNFSNFSSLTGATVVDQFTVDATGSMTTINAGDGANTFSVAGTVGTINSGSGDDAFTISGSVTNINSNDGNDTFSITGNITTLNTGAGMDNAVISAGTIGTVNLGNDADVISVSGGNVTLINMGTGADAFTITGGVVGTANGNAGNDTFTDSGGTVGTMDGGADIDFIVDTGAVVNLTVGTDIGGFEGVQAANNNGTLNAQANETTTWTIDGSNSGNVSDSDGENLAFIGFSTLNGGGGVDNFVVNGNGSVTGTVGGGANNDTLSIDLNNANRNLSGQITFVGGTNNGGAGDQITVTGTANAYSETFNPNQGGNDQLVYENGSGVTFGVNYRGTETVNDNIQTSTLTINSSSSLDNVQLGANTFGSNLASVDVNYQGGSKNNLTVIGQGGSDVEIVGAVTIGGELNVTADQVREMNAGASIVADTLTLNSVRVAGTNADGLTTDVNNLNVTNHTGNVYIDEQNGIALTAISGTLGSINVTIASGSISSNAALQYDGTLDLNSAANIDLSSPQNNLTGPLNLVAVNNVTLNNNTVTNLSGVSAQNLMLVSDGDVTDNGVIDIQNAGSGFADITSTTGSIVLDNATNNFDVVNLNAANDATLVESDGIMITGTMVGGELNVTSNNGLLANDSAIGNMALGTISADTINLNASEGAIVDQSSNLTASSVTLAAATGIGGGVINYSDANGFSNIDVSGSINTTTATLSATNTTSGTINIDNTGDVSVQDLRNSGDIILTNTGDISLAVSQNGNTSIGAIDANYGGDIDDQTYAGSVAILSGGTDSVTTNGIGFSEADITAENLLVNSVYSFGEQASPIRLRVNNQFTLFASQGAVFYFGGRPNNVTTSAELALLVIEGVTGLSGQQLIDLETLGEVDPAIFTEVRNYNYDDVAILLPADQRYTDEDEEDNKEKQAQ